mgnify:CR=1 FL=1
MAQLRLVLVVAETGLHTAGLEGTEVGAGRNLAVGVLRRQPDFQIVGLGGGETHVAGAQHDATIGQFQRFEDGFGVAGQLFVRSGGVVGMDDLHQLDLVELMLADHAAHVAAARTGFGTEARGMADQLQGQHLKGEDFDVSLTGFDEKELARLFAEEDGAEEDGFDVDAELEKPCFSKAGDVWHLGRHTIICGDSTKPETYSRLLGKEKVNLVCTDPPYLVNLESTSGKIKNDDLSDEEGYKFLRAAFEQFHEAMAKDASIYVFYATAKARVFHDAYEDAGFKVGAGLVWKKNRLVLTRTDWKYIHEPIIWGWRKDGKHEWYGDQKQVTVFEFDRIKDSKKDGCGHPSSKPVPLIAYLIRQCTQTNGLVLDGFLGSASTLIACEQLGRVCYGVELEPKFVDVAVKRYLEFRNGDAADVYVERNGEKIPYEIGRAHV